MSAETSAETTRALITRYYDAFNRGDVAQGEIYRKKTDDLWGNAMDAYTSTRKLGPMCETSNSAAEARHWRCSVMMPAGYWTGMA